MPRRAPRRYPLAVTTIATLTICWAALFAYVGTYHCLLYARRRAEREYLLFGLLAFAMAGYTYANAWFVGARHLSESTFAFQFAGGATVVAVPLFVHFCGALGRTTQRLIGTAYLWSIMGALGLALNLLTEKGGVPQPSFGIDCAPLYIQPRVSLVAQVHLWVGVSLCAASAWQLTRHARSNKEFVAIAVTMTASVIATIHDLLVRLGHVRSFYLLEHCALLCTVAMSYILLDRFVRTSEALELRTTELRTSYEELRATQAILVRKEQLAAVGELSAVIAHEIRNPLAVIKNASSALRRPNLETSDRSTLLDILDEETDRLNRVMHDLLAYARPITPTLEPLVVDSLIAEALEYSDETLRSQSIAIELDFDNSATQLFGDRELLRRAIRNVVENAAQAMPEGGVFRVRTEATSIADIPAIAIVLEDTGEGMDTIVRKKARDPFFTTRSTGTGLGLAIVDRVIRNHGGMLELEAQHGAGTRVTLILPIQPDLRTSLRPHGSSLAPRTPGMSNSRAPEPPRRTS